jgi:hypothetical protein
MSYSIAGLNYTTLSNTSGDPSNISNKWVVSVYPNSMGSGTIPAYSNISGVTPIDTKLVADQTDLLASAKLQNRDNFITKFSTRVYLSSSKTVSFTMTSDDTSRFYLNGLNQGTVASWNAPSTFSVTFPAGWSTVDIMQAEWGGLEALTLTPSLSSQVTTMIAESNTFKARLAEVVSAMVDKFVDIEVKSIFKETDGSIQSSVSMVVRDLYNKFIENNAADVIEILDVAKIVEDKINEFDVDFAEQVILEISSRELKAITWLGALLGAIMGLLSPILNMLY